MSSLWASRSALRRRLGAGPSLRRLAALFLLLSFVAGSFVAVQAHFFDGVSAGMNIVVGPFEDTIPAECAAMDFKHFVTGTDGDDALSAGNGKSLVLGLGGNDTLSAGNAADCMVGGPGDDILYGGNGADVLDGGDGYDVCIGGLGPMTFVDCEAYELAEPTEPVLEGGATLAPTSTPSPTPGATEVPTLAPVDTLAPEPTSTPEATVTPTPEPTTEP